MHLRILVLIPVVMGPKLGERPVPPGGHPRPHKMPQSFFIPPQTALIALGTCRRYIRLCVAACGGSQFMRVEHVHVQEADRRSSAPWLWTEVVESVCGAAVIAFAAVPLADSRAGAD